MLVQRLTVINVSNDITSYRSVDNTAQSYPHSDYDSVCDSWIGVSEIHAHLYILQRGVQRKQGVVNYMMLFTILLYNTTTVHCTPHPLHPPLQSIQIGVSEIHAHLGMLC